MNDYRNFCEYAVKPDDTGKLRLLRAVLIALYTLLTAWYILFFYLMLRQWQLLILLPFIMYAVIMLTWRYTVVEYEFAIEAGVLTVATIYDGRVRRQKFSKDVGGFLRVSPLTDRAKLTGNPEILHIDDFSKSAVSTTAWYAVYADKSGKGKNAVVFETNDEMLRILRIGCQSAVVK